MHYFRKVTDLETGEVRRISIGEHLTVTEAAQRFGVARSSLVKVLLRLNIFQKEFDTVAGEHRYRLRPEAQTKGMGYRIMGKHGPFDVLAPTTLDWIEEDLKALLSASTADTKTIAALQALDTFDQGRTHKLDLEGKVRWVVDHFPEVSPSQVAKGLGVSEQIIHRYLTRRREQLERALARLKRGVVGKGAAYSDPSQDLMPLAA